MACQSVLNFNLRSRLSSSPTCSGTRRHSSVFGIYCAAKPFELRSVSARTIIVVIGRRNKENDDGISHNGLQLHQRLLTQEAFRSLGTYLLVAFNLELGKPGEVMNEAESPFRRLVHMVQHVSRKALRNSVNDIWSVVHESDCVAEEAPVPVGKGSISNPFIIPTDPDLSRARIKTNQALEEEIREINQRLLDIVVRVIPDGSYFGTMVECSFNPVTISPKILHQSIEPLRLVVPGNYPECSPSVILKRRPEDGEFSVKGKSRLELRLRSLIQPLSLKDIAERWCDCVREVMTEYAMQNGGGSFSSRNGTWERL